jgi:hypothetical protein
LLVLAAGVLALPVKLEGTLGVLLGHGDAGAFAGTDEGSRASTLDTWGRKGSGIRDSDGAR